MAVRPPTGGYNPPFQSGKNRKKKYLPGFNPGTRGNAPEILSGRGGMQQPGMGGGFGSPGMSGGGGFGNQMSNGFGGGQASGMSGFAPGGPNTMGQDQPLRGPEGQPGGIGGPHNPPTSPGPTSPGPDPNPPGPTDFQPPNRGPTGPMGPTGTPGTPGRPDTQPSPTTPFNPPTTGGPTNRPPQTPTPGQQPTGFGNNPPQDPRMPPTTFAHPGAMVPTGYPQSPGMGGGSNWQDAIPTNIPGGFQQPSRAIPWGRNTSYYNLGGDRYSSVINQGDQNTFKQGQENLRRGRRRFARAAKAPKQQARIGSTVNQNLRVMQPGMRYT